MCHKGLCMMCIPVRTGCLIVAVLFMIYHITTFIGCIQQLIAILLTLNFFHIVLTIILMVVHFVCVIFTALLMHGVRTGNPGLVKTYFIFGLMLTVLRVIYVLILALHGNGDLELFSVIYALFEFIFGTLFLVLVYYTHRVISGSQSSVNTFVSGLALA